MFRSLSHVLLAVLFAILASAAFGQGSPIEVFACMRPEVKSGAPAQINVTVLEPGVVTTDDPVRFRTARTQGTSASIDVPKDASLLTVFVTKTTTFTLTVRGATRQVTITVVE